MTAWIYSPASELTFFAQVEFEIPQRDIITPQVVTTDSRIIYTGHSPYFKAGENVIGVEFPIENWNVSPYDLFLIEDLHTTNKKLRFTLESE